jgi:hypothetical protein
VASANSAYQEAIKAYWSAQTPAEHRAAYAQMRKLGCPAMYNEIDSYMGRVVDRIYCALKRNGLVP